MAQQAETANSGRIRLLHLSDLHFGTEDVSALTQVETFAAHAKPDGVLVSGDLTQIGARTEFAAAQDWLQRIFGKPVVTPGNHDTPIFHLPARVFGPFDRYKKMLGDMDATGQTVEIAGGRVRVGAINTARGWQTRRNWADGVVDLDDLDAALTELAKGPSDAWRLLLCHHPLLLPPELSHIGVKTLRGREAFARTATASVDAVLTGHIHDAFALPDPETGLLQLGAGTLSTRRRGSPPSFCVLDIEGDKLTQQVVRLDGGAMEIQTNYVTRRALSEDGTRAAAAR
jgi:3',5'-cyclic AMP phosphodiesterase CpdA